MRIPDSYKNHIKIYESSNSRVYRAFDDEMNRPVIIKKLNKVYPTPDEVSRFHREYKLLCMFSGEGVIQPYGLSLIDNTPAIAMEDISGKTLADILKTVKTDLNTFLDFSITIAGIIGNIHKKNIIHKDINPSNIIWNIEKDKVRVIDFGNATELNREITSVKNPNVLEGTLAYISPEQTGRMNRALDYRTDFYSLGITFYQMLTGHLPFESRDLLRLVHSHIAIMPVSPSEIDKQIPEAVSNIVMKLMAKNAEDRYNSTHGLIADLERCRCDLLNKGKIEFFQPGLDDVSGKFQIPQKLYGREGEIETLISAFERISRNENTELMLVSGTSGIGKSALINELQKPIVEYRGYFIAGKFEKLKKDVPYSGIIQALTGFARQILAEDRSEIALWKDKLLEVLGPNGRIVTDIIPLFEPIIGRQPEAPVLGTAESQNRFKLVFQDFIKVLASKEHPLVIFLDDIQWADLASFNLLKFFTTDPSIKNLLMIGAYRDNEVAGSHPLVLTLDEIKKTGSVVNQIVLNPLDKSNACTLLEETLRRTEDETGPLAELLISKTGGNPFFINEFLHFLYKKRLIEFSFKNGWTWSITGIEELKVTDNVVDLMVGKIIALPENSQNVLKFGACLGSYFNIAALENVCGYKDEELQTALSDILREGLLNRIDNIYRFTHDRILEAAYSLISDEEKSKLHYRIGTLELINIDKDKFDEKIFYIVNHLNAGTDLISNASQKYELAGLNHMAGEKALKSNAYGSALNYFKSGIGLLEENSWDVDYDLTLALYRDASISAQLCAEYDSLEKYSNVVLNNARTILDKIKVFEAKISACTAQNQLLEGIRIGLYVLKKLGTKLPEKPGKLRIILKLISLKLFLMTKPVDDLINLPELKDPHKLAVMQILSGITTSAYYAVPDLVPIVSFEMVKMSVKYGTCIYSPYAYAGFAMVHCGVLGDMTAGYKWGELALNLVRKFNIIETKARVWLVVWFFVDHWKKPLRDSLKPVLEAYKTGLETGDLEFAAICASTYSYNSFDSGIELSGIEKDMAKYDETVRKLNQGTLHNYYRIIHQAVLNLRGKSSDPCRLIGSEYDETVMLPVHKNANDANALFCIYLIFLNFNYIFENYTEALKNAELVEPYSREQISHPEIPIIVFYDSLTRLALYCDEKKSVQKKILKSVNANQKKMKKWAFHSPANYSHKYLLVEAEIARIKKQELKAREHFKLAVKQADENGFMQEKALALKLTAKFWLDLNEEKIASLYMAESIHTYRLWGAAAVVKYLESTYGHLLRLKTEKTDTADKGTSTTSTSESMDITTVIKSSQILSSEIDLTRLLETTMRITLENAGAQRGFLIMESEEDKNLYIEAEGEADKEIKGGNSIPLEKSHSLSSNVVNYVQRTGENVVLDYACKFGDFTNDPYIRDHEIKSLLCTPITFKGKTSGILYLENNLATNVFTPDRLELLRILTAQAAISVENARLLTHRENKAKLEKEIEMAEKIQRSLLPVNIPEIDRVRVAFKYNPMMGVGGDFVNIFYKKDENKIGLFICDVSGHGVYAAMVASMVSNSLDFFWNTYFESPARVMKEVSNFLKGKMGGNFFTGCICSVDLISGFVTMANAGHPSLLLLRKNGTYELKGTKGRLISEYVEPNQEDVSFQLESGDTIVLYTDGITEAENSGKDVIGADDDKFCQWVQKHHIMSSSPDELCENIYKGVVGHTGTDRLDDDFTILVMEYI